VAQMTLRLVSFGWLPRVGLVSLMALLFDVTIFCTSSIC
jgi:hypothetical protein